MSCHHVSPVLLYYKCTPVLQSTTPVLLCTTKYYSSTTTAVLQSTTPVLLCTTKYYSSTTLYYKVLLQYYSVLQSITPVLLCTTKYYSSTTLYYKYCACTTKYYCTNLLQSTTPVLLCTTKYYSSLLCTTMYYNKYYSVILQLLCTTNTAPVHSVLKEYSSTTLYLQSYSSTSVLHCTPVLLCTKILIHVLSRVTMKRYLQYALQQSHPPTTHQILPVLLCKQSTATPVK